MGSTSSGDGAGSHPAPGCWDATGHDAGNPPGEGQTANLPPGGDIEATVANTPGAVDDDMFEDIIYYGFRFQVYSFTKPVSASRATHTLDGTPIEEARPACRQRASHRQGWGSGGIR